MDQFADVHNGRYDEDSKDTKEGAAVSGPGGGVDLSGVGGIVNF